MTGWFSVANNRTFPDGLQQATCKQCMKVKVIQPQLTIDTLNFLPKNDAGSKLSKFRFFSFCNMASIADSLDPNEILYYVASNQDQNCFANITVIWV